MPYGSHFKTPFGAYVQEHVQGDNTMSPRTLGAIALRSTGNPQESMRMFSLDSGRVISVRKWTALPMPREVVERVHQLGRRAKAPTSVVFTTATTVPSTGTKQEEEW